jgi:hypothetical protein
MIEGLEESDFLEAFGLLLLIHFRHRNLSEASGMTRQSRGRNWRDPQVGEGRGCGGPRTGGWEALGGCGPGGGDPVTFLSATISPSVQRFAL